MICRLPQFRPSPTSGHSSYLPSPPRLRTTLIQLAWLWLRHQPRSALALWFENRVRRNGGRHKKTTIVALALKLLVALWKYVTAGVVIEGAMMKPPDDRRSLNPRIRPRGKHFFDGSNDLVGCGHMSGLLMRSICPLALMKSDDQDHYQSNELYAQCQVAGCS